MRGFAWASVWKCVGASVAALAILTFPAGRAIADGQGTLSLDSDSFLSYSESQNPHIAAGSTIRFRFGTASADGSVPISVRPEDVSIAPVPVAEGLAIDAAASEQIQTALEYLAKRARGDKWYCSASCNVQGIGDFDPPVPRVQGGGYGSTEGEACRSAKQNATQSTPPNCYPRHCKCRCTKL